MNRQAIAFLTMFSLVLMLAVYYVTMPIHPNDETEVVSTNNALLDMQNAINSKRESLLNDYTSIIASSDSSSNDKSLAMENMSYLQTIMNEEKEYKNLIKQLGYSDCVVEIENDLVRITVLKEEHTTSDASKIIKTVLVQSNYQYIPEVTFYE